MSERRVTPRESTVPTPEQLGETVDLEEGAGLDLELQEPAPAPPAVPVEELEFVPPKAEEAPERSRHELPTLVGDASEAGFAEGESVTAAGFGPPPEPVQAEALASERLERSPVAPSGPVLVSRPRSEGTRPATFLELLDGSLSLLCPRSRL